VTGSWSAARAERHLLDLELFGMRFGLDRMRRLMTALGSPERRFASIHVVGTNGKSSTARMTAAVLERHGVRTGAYLSPHLVSFTERIRVAERDLEPAAFGAAVQRAARAASKVDRTLEPGDRVTQFEVLTAAAYSEMARRGVEVAVVEAGLGGRWDATNVLPSSVQVLTNVGLDHQRWLGPTIADIAREKLAVVRDGATLVTGDLGSGEAEREARSAAERHGARLVRAPADPGVPVAALGAFQRRNLAVAAAAAEAHLGHLDPDALRAAAAEVVVPGRLEPVDREPLTLLDGAHNPAGIAALTEALPEVAGAGPARGPLVGVVSILEDKEAAPMLAALLPHLDAAVLTASASPRALPPATLRSLAGQLGAGPGPDALETVPAPRRALARARELAGPGGVVLVTGSIYLIADLVSAPGRRRASAL
jgi:dihydrofolate synthase / folylpolyglutamate synthase